MDTKSPYFLWYTENTVSIGAKFGVFILHTLLYILLSTDYLLVFYTFKQLISSFHFNCLGNAAVPFSLFLVYISHPFLALDTPAAFLVLVICPPLILGFTLVLRVDFCYV